MDIGTYCRTNWSEEIGSELLMLALEPVQNNFLKQTLAYLLNEVLAIHFYSSNKCQFDVRIQSCEKLDGVVMEKRWRR